MSWRVEPKAIRADFVIVYILFHQSFFGRYLEIRHHGSFKGTQFFNVDAQVDHKH